MRHELFARVNQKYLLENTLELIQLRKAHKKLINQRYKKHLKEYFPIKKKIRTYTLKTCKVLIFQPNKIQMGIKNVVNIIIQRLNPSIVKSKFVLKNGNILNSSIY